MSECLVCCKSSQTDIDGKGTGKRGLKNFNKHLTKYQITSIYIFRKLFDISKSVCVSLLQNNNGTNPSTWFSLCWECFSLIQSAEKTSNKLLDLEKQLTNLKMCIQRKLVESYETGVKNKTSKSTKNKNQNVSRNIREEAFTAISQKESSPTQSDDYELLEDIKIETDENSFNEHSSNDCENNSSFEHKLGDQGNDDDLKCADKYIPKRKRNRRSVRLKSELGNLADFSDPGDNLKPHQPDEANESTILKDSRDTSSSDTPTKTDDIDSSSGKGGGQPKETLNNSESKEKYEEHGNVPGAAKNFICRYCDKQYTCVKRLRSHLRLVHTENFAADPSCGFYRRKSFHNEPAEACPICGKKFRTLRSVILHKRNEHHNIEIQEKSLQAAISQKGSSPTQSDDYELLEDIKIETDENSFSEQTSNDCENKRSFEHKLDGQGNDDDLKCTDKYIPKVKLNRRSVNSKNKLENASDFSSDPEDNLEPHQPDEANESTNLKDSRDTSDTPTKTDDIDSSSGMEGADIKFNCRYCDKQYTNVKMLRSHLRSVHTENFDADRSCGFYRRKAFYNEPAEACPICGKKFRTLKSLIIHKRNGHHNLEVQPFTCKHCNSSFPNELKLKSHIYLHHDKKQLPFKCEECYHRSASFSRLQLHIARIHRKEKNYICEICSESFVDKSSLKVHQMRSHEEPNKQEDTSVQCEECGKIMRCFSNLQKHIQVVHRRQYKFHCAVCNVGRISQSAMDAHILRAHTDAPQPYACTDCDKTYVSKSRLTIHMRSHTGERPYKCPICSKAFFEKCKMVRHQRSLHVTERRFECEKCHSKFPSQHYLASHIYSKHNKKVDSRPPKQVVDKQELLKCVESTRKERCREYPKSHVTLHLEQQIKQGALLDTDYVEEPSSTLN